MKHYIILALCLGLSVNIIAQDSSPALSITKAEVEDNTYASRGLLSKLKSRLGKNYTMTEDAYFSLSSHVSFGDIHTINGMDTYITTDADITYTLSADGIPSETFNGTVKCKAKSERDLAGKIGSCIIRDSKHCEQLSTFIDAYMEKALGTCSKVTSAINKALQDNNTMTAYTMLSYYDNITGCETVKSSQEDAIVKKHEVLVCAKIVQDAEVLANSGSERSMGKAIDLLLLIPPGAPCAEDAIRISELVNTNATELSKYSADKIRDRIVIRNTMTNADWKQWYRTNYSKYSGY